MLWRYPGDGDDEWRVHEPVEYMARDTFDFIEALFPGYQLKLIDYDDGEGFTTEGGDYLSPGFATALTVRNNVDPGFTQTEGTWPTSGQTIEVAVRYTGAPTEDLPRLIEFDQNGDKYTLGTWLRDLYDGVYSLRDSVTGEIVPTNIRYTEADLLQLTDPVRIYLTEPITDIRDEAEAKGYGPSGWAPALDHDLYISPVSQVPPQDEQVTLIDNDVTQPSPNWNGGETIVNVLSLTYPRYYKRTDEEAYFSFAGLGHRDIELIARSEQSVGLHSEQAVEYDGSWFVAFGLAQVDGFGVPLNDLDDEVGYGLFQDRRAYILDRYEYGAQIIIVPVKRSRTYGLRAGDWVVVDLSWLPDYVTQRRDAAWLGQVIAIKDLDCAWRELIIEEALPVDVS